MSFPIKRKRGRPRRDEPREINGFDLALIKEFQSRPAFYDRSHMHYRNRDYLEPQWLEMARNLDQPVGVIKNRMLQLRNRYNVEKNRVDQFPDNSGISTWILYEHMTFLGDHIKARRSYERVEEAEDSVVGDEFGDSQHYINESSNNAIDQGADEDKPLSTFANNKNRSTVNTAESLTLPVLRSSTRLSDYNNRSTLNSRCDAASNQNNTISNGGHEKFKAFGQFLSSSLIELNETDALNLVEKFTSDIVKSFTQD